MYGRTETTRCPHCGQSITSFSHRTTNIGETRFIVLSCRECLTFLATVPEPTRLRSIVRGVPRYEPAGAARGEAG